MSNYPENDAEFEDKLIESVETNRDGTYSICCDGWHLWCGEKSSVVPQAGQTARFYGRGIGYPVRGLFIAEKKLWYRTPDEEEKHLANESYGADATEWLKRWDDGRSVWTIEMGGLGPGYEQCIHVTCAEILRWLLEHKPTEEEVKADQKIVREKIDRAMFANPTVDRLGISGAQYGAATNIAFQLYWRGPIAIMVDPDVADRHIQVRKGFP